MILAAMALMAASCTSESFEQSVEQQAEQTAAPVTVRVDGFAVSQEEFSGTTRATAVGSYAGVSFLTLAFYASNVTEVYKVTQNRDDNTTFTTFGEFSTSLPLGSYTMVVLRWESVLQCGEQADGHGRCRQWSEAVRPLYVPARTVRQYRPEGDGPRCEWQCAL